MSPNNHSAQQEASKPTKETQAQEHVDVPIRPVDRPVVPLTDAEAHYNSLVGYLKYLVTITMAAIALGVSVFFFATFRNRAEMRAEMRQDLADIRSEIRQSASDMKSDAKSTIDNAKEQASAAINYTKATTGTRLALPTSEL